MDKQSGFRVDNMMISVFLTGSVHSSDSTALTIS